MKCLNFSEKPNRNISNYSQKKMYNKKESFLEESWSEIKKIYSDLSLREILFFIFFILGIFFIFYFSEFTFNPIMINQNPFSTELRLNLFIMISVAYIIINLILSLILAIIINQFYIIYTQKFQLSNIKCISCTLQNK